ncbi:helix-turn-helix domain-containing protein [Roseateles saccharophilus]|uniref:Crp-like helix-turn-helix protein n=1 Tax=Roseateles saccharophilus TaxID=304 RepID=A0A4R3VDX9_ROSSA|nr:helix-turn-helix domain-containing protein [Roseateles saccharophilus]MDG0833030.1 helix-turn-helix domain-containing protein [Roseateles saccharophilus]TCV02123.1 Crp-like helix-turn-helix protein [Roseateles saccharophilus]
MLLGVESWLGQAHGYDLVSCTSAQVSRLRCRDVEDNLLQQPERYRRLLRHWHQSLSDSQAWSAELLRGSARQRILQLLLWLVALSAARAGQHSVWLPRREDMGAMLGLAEETASRQISPLCREGLCTPGDHEAQGWMLPA